MTIDNQNQSPENQTNLQKIKDNQEQKDFNDIIKIFEKMSIDEQKRFIDNMNSKDPEFRELYKQLNTFVWDEIKKIETKENTKVNNKSSNKSDKLEEQKTQNEINQETNKIFSLLETKMTFLEQNKDFKNFNYCFENKEVNNNIVPVLKPNIYEAYSRYNSNKEPLAIALGEKEIEVAKQELKNSLKASSNMPYALQNMDLSRQYAEKQYEDKVNQIIANFIRITDNFVKLIENTDIGRNIISNTTMNNFNEKLKKDINKNIGYKENNDSNLELKIENDTREVIGKISELQNKLNNEINNFKLSQENLKQRDYINWEKMLYNDIPKKYEGLITEEIDTYAKNIGKDLILNNAPCIKEQKVFNLPIGDKEIVLDFSELGNIEGKSEEQKLKLYEKHFKNIYKNTLSSKIWRELTSKKGLVDISGIIISGAVAAEFSIDTIGAGIPAAAIIFTATENAYRARMYELFDIEGGWQSGTGIDMENDSKRDIFRKKGFELVSNGVLFGLFRLSGWSKEKMLNYISKPGFAEKLHGKLTTYGIKTTTEAIFFTYYTIASNNLQDNIKNGGNKEEILESFLKVGNMNEFMRLFAYNMGFISLVKAGGKIVGIKDKNKIISLEKEIINELQILETKGYFIVGEDYYKGNNKLITPPADFQTLNELNKKLLYLTTDTYRKPESGRAGKTINTDRVDPVKRYERLEKYSKQTQTGKISYALGDKTIGEILQTQGLKEGKGVGEGLLKKSGFSDDEINQFNKGELKGEKDNEVKALSEMNKALNIIYKEYKEGFEKIQKGIPINDIFPNLSKDLIQKLETIYSIDYNILPKKGKKH